MIPAGTTRVSEVEAALQREPREYRGFRSNAIALDWTLPCFQSVRNAFVAPDPYVVDPREMDGAG